MNTLIDRVRAALADRYRIVRELGSGGAAIVFLAEDLKHERRVAVKVFRPELAASLGADRFLREIKIAAKLSHPHILPVYDSGEADGLLYYVMPVVEGESLRQRLARDQTVSIEETVRLLHHLLDALHYAHTRGVVHRDIKPDNVMLSGRHALITDFGVAKALSAAADPADADTLGVVLGTPAYMAPEQAAGDPGVDHRADLYSVGVLAYELLVGLPPFRGDTPQAVLAAHITQQAIPVTEVRAEIPPVLSDVVMKSLEKTPEARWQSAHEVMEYLGPTITPSGGNAPVQAPVVQPGGRKRRFARLGAAVALLVAALLGVGSLLRGPSAAEDRRPVLAVIPFDNLGPDQDGYFASGVASAITARLAKLRGLAVISRTSAIQYKSSEKSAQEIGRELQVDYILEGTVQRERPADSTSRVRVTPQLVRVSDDTQVWGTTYDKDVTEVFDVQSDIAERVASALDVTLLEPERKSLEARPTENLEAYEAYLRGHDYLEGNAGSGNANARRIAVDQFRNAIDLDGSFALAYAELSTAHMWLYRWFVDPSDERLAMAKAAVDSALALQPDLPDAHLALGYYHYWKDDADADLALEEFRTVVQTEPNNTFARTMLGALQAARGEWNEAVANAALAADLDPREPEWAASAGWFHLLVRQYAEAERLFNRAIALAPDLADAYRGMMSLRLQQGDTIGARKVVADMLTRVTPGEVAVALVDVAPVLIADGTHDSLFLNLTPASVIGPLPFDYLHGKAVFYRVRNRPELAVAYSDSLLAALTALPPERASSPVATVFFARAYAGLGRRAEAQARADQIEALIDGASDALRAGELGYALVWIYATMGEHDRAMDHIEHLLSVPSLVSLEYLRIELFPQELKEHVRFRSTVGEAT